jgi:hypothetical protein
MRSAQIALSIALAASPAFSQSGSRTQTLEEERARADEVTRQLQGLDVLGPKPAAKADGVGPRRDEIVIPNVSIYCGTSNCNQVAAKLCADLGYRASRPSRPHSAASGVVCSDP